MAKGYIEIEEIPKRCFDCWFCPYGLCLVRVPSGKPVDPETRPDWCPIKEHDLGVCAEKHKEEMEELHREATERVGW